MDGYVHKTGIYETDIIKSSVRDEQILIGKVVQSSSQYCAKHKPVYQEASGIMVLTSLKWRHNGHDSVPNHQPHDCVLNRLFRRRWKKTSKLRVTGLCVGKSPRPVNSPHKGPVTRKMFPFDDVIMIAHLSVSTTHYVMMLIIENRRKEWVWVLF